MNNMNLIKATIKDSYREIHKKVKAYYRENPKSKVSVEKTVAICATELLGEDCWSFIKETGLGTFVCDAIIAGGPFQIRLYWVDALYEKYVSQGKPRVDKEQVVKAIKSWEKEEWAYFTKQNIDAYFSEPQLYDKSTGDIYYAVKAWEWLHDSNKAR